MKQWKRNFAWLAVLLALFSVPAWADDSAGGAEGALPYRYAWTGWEDVPVYAKPGDLRQMTPDRHLVAYYTWVSIKEELRSNQDLWYRIGDNEYILADDVWVGPPTALQGVVVPQERRPPFGFVVTDDLNVRARPGVSADNPSIAKLARYTVVNIQDRITIGDTVWYQIGDEGSNAEQYVHGEYVRVVTTTARPEGVAPDEKWIAVNRTEQTVAAYEGDQMVFATLVSTGLPWWQTPDGLFRIWTKRRIGDMTGGSPTGEYYYLVQDVPWTMYFHGPYALHAAYWHDDFGYEHSRGCVNLSPRDARWLFEWSSPSVPGDQVEMFSNAGNPGTWVYVHSTPAGPGLTQPAG
jgi:lipoprotein-anchoring transpeptidase ErfK/SrfK